LLLRKRLEKPESIKGIYQWRADEQMTKYDMALVMTHQFHLPNDHLNANTSPPSANDAAARPHDCCMKTDRLEELGARITVPFAQGICDLAEHLGGQ